ncbi:efflux RND transporter periplasmic adaptor subunit [Chthonobacter albigriseus]|uniref:efflux RND transporter periplasmic adaptor subunit n=1 Tax=Chthonobacter albigriseus TaxID=1683161 RepID=UPI0015EFDBCB|nr:efflux RND transporter periplasmic adaptor subunit [Chthonobacter albigriseus]
MRRTTVVILILILLAAAGAAGWIYSRPLTVTTQLARHGDAAELVYATGVVEPKRWAKVTSLVRERIMEVCDCEGETVQAGHLLVRLDDSETRANMRQLEARRMLANTELARAADLLERSVGSRQTWERANAELAQIEASLAAMLEQANDHLITAPIAGQVLRLDASVGEIADPGEALAWVGSARPLEVVADVNEEDIPRIATGQKVLLRSDAFPGQVLTGSVGLITPKGDPVAKTYRVRLSLPDDTPLFIGMSVDANVVVREVKNTIVVPSAALSGNTVFVVQGGEARSVSVEVGIRGLETTEIVSGLKGDETVVSPLPEDLTDGAKVVATEGGS